MIYKYIRRFIPLNKSNIKAPIETLSRRFGTDKNSRYCALFTHYRINVDTIFFFDEPFENPLTPLTI